MGLANLYSVPAQIAYDPKVLQLVNISNGGLLSRDGQPVALVLRRSDRDPGTIQVTASASTEFRRSLRTRSSVHPDLHGQSGRTVDDQHNRQVSARDANMQPMPMNGAQAMVTVK